MKSFAQSDPVPAVIEREVRGSTAEIFADIRRTLSVDVVNLIWRHLATMPGALERAWASLKPLYSGSAVILAAHVRKDLMLPHVPPLSHDTLVAAGIDGAALSSIRAILDSLSTQTRWR